MSCAKPSPNLPVKIGPPISVWRLQRIKGSTMPPTEVQPMKSCYQRIKEFRIPPLETWLKQGMNLAQSLGVQPSSHVWCNILCKYLDSFHTKMVTLSNSQQLHPHVALQQLCAGVISKEDIVQDDDCDEDRNIPKSYEHTPPDGNMDSETEEQAVEDVMEPVDEGNSVMDDRGNKPSGMNKSSDEHSDWSTDKRHSLKLEQTRLPMEAICEAQALGMCTMQKAQAIADKYGKMLISIMTATGLTSKATQVESVWNMHQAWYAHTNPKASGEHMKDYYSRQMKHYEDHKDEEEFPQLWAEIHMFWSKSISSSKDTSSKVQTWCNVEGIHVFGCIIYSGSDEAACQAQGIFAGSALCMQLAGEKQMDISRLLDYLATIVKYKVLDSAASVPLPDSTVWSQPPYYWTLALKPQESRCDHNCHVLPVVFMHKLYEANLVGGQRNVPWKTLLDVLYTAQYTVIDWPAHVPAVGPDVNIRCLNANELHGLVVPFLKEQVGADYYAEAPGEDQDQDGSMVVPSLSFDLKKWTPRQAFLRVLPRGVLPPKNRLMSSLPPSSPLEESLQPSQSNPSPLPPIEELPQLPTRGHIQSTSHHHIPQEGTIIALLNMYIETIPTSSPMAMIWMMKTIIDIITMQATKVSSDELGAIP
ncbi:hypothetical protein EDC04DRAFT_2606255 [Pisolithus marmoratus]|nr:hypothetical protein EDC04DRAFT_2606255 [Pisolithus marmoratus]